MTEASAESKDELAAPESFAAKGNKRWYVVHAYSGMEKAVERNGAGEETHAARLAERVAQQRVRTVVPHARIGRGQRAGMFAARQPDRHPPATEFGRLRPHDTRARHSQTLPP